MPIVTQTNRKINKSTHSNDTTTQSRANKIITFACGPLKYFLFAALIELLFLIMYEDTYENYLKNIKV
jgi:hypothetical protein